MKKSFFYLFFVLVIFALPAIACGVLFDSGAYPQQPQQPVVITVVVPQPQQPQPQQPTLPPVSPPSEPTSPPPPPPPPPTSAPEKPIFTANRDLSCADGPSWYKYWFVVRFDAYDSAPIVGINGKYGLVEYKGNRCWVLLTEGTIKGSTSGLPTIEAPPLPVVEVWVENQLGQYVYLVFFDWETGDRVATLALPQSGQTGRVKLPSGYYSIWGYDKNDQNIYRSDMLNLAVGDGNHISGLEDGVYIVITP